MEGEGGTSRAETGASVGPTVEASSVSQPEVGPEISAVDALEQKVGELQELRAQTERIGEGLEAPTAESLTTLPASAGGEGLGQALAGPEQKLVVETEAQVPTQEVPKVPGKFASDPEYIRIVGEHYHEVKQQGGEINRAKIAEITEQSISEYYDNWAKDQVEKGLPEETKSDPLYQQKLGEVVTNAQDRGEPLDANKLSQEALSTYQQEKDLQAEKAAEPQAEQLTTDQRLEDVAQRLSALLENNREKLDSATVNVSAKDLALLLKALAEAKEPNQKKKENKLMLLLKLLGLLGLAAVAEAGKTVTGQQGR